MRLSIDVVWVGSKRFDYFGLRRVREADKKKSSVSFFGNFLLVFDCELLHL